MSVFGRSGGSVTPAGLGASSPAGGGGQDPALEAENLRVRYRNGALGVLDVSVRVGTGQVVALFGPNGAGKTTLVRAVSGFLKSEGARVVSGRVLSGGHDITNADPSRTSRLGVSLVPERNKIFPTLTVRENLNALGVRPPRARREELFEQVFDLFPILKTRLRQQAGALSGGQQQMLALGRSLLTEPKLLLVDEMTQGLHHSMQPPLFEAVKRIAAMGTAVLLVDESTGFALELAEHCYFIDGGRVRREGRAEEFKKDALAAAGYVEPRSP